MNNNTEQNMCEITPDDISTICEAEKGGSCPFKIPFFVTLSISIIIIVILIFMLLRKKK